MENSQLLNLEFFFATVRGFKQKQRKMDDLDVEDVDQIIRGVLEKVLVDVESFEWERVPEWTDAILYQCLNELVILEKPFKYIVECIINQRDGAGLFSHSNCCFDVEWDLLTCVSWNNDVLRAIVTVYALVLD